LRQFQRIEEEFKESSSDEDMKPIQPEKIRELDLPQNPNQRRQKRK
jgi:hypothetical protein